jgi:hypothetical protein
MQSFYYFITVSLFFLFLFIYLFIFDEKKMKMGKISLYFLNNMRNKEENDYYFNIWHNEIKLKHCIIIIIIVCNIFTIYFQIRFLLFLFYLFDDHHTLKIFEFESNFLRCKKI